MAFREAISRAEATGKVARETAEASLRALEETIRKTGAGKESEELFKAPVDEAIGGWEEAGEALEVTAEEPEEALEEEVVGATGVTDADAEGKREVGEPSGRIEARLESLARMYETKKAKQAEAEDVAEDKETDEDKEADEE